MSEEKNLLLTIALLDIVKMNLLQRNSDIARIHLIHAFVPHLIVRQLLLGEVALESHRPKVACSQTIAVPELVYV